MGEEIISRKSGGEERGGGEKREKVLGAQRCSHLTVEVLVEFKLDQEHHQHLRKQNH